MAYRTIRIGLTCLLAGVSLASAQSVSDRGALVRVDGAGAPAGLGLLILNLDKESRLQWRAVDVDKSDTSLTALLTRVNQWPVGSMTKATEALICDRNPHVCCPYSPDSPTGARTNCLAELRLNTPSSLSPKIEATRQSCREISQRYITDPSLVNQICTAVWRFIPKPDSHTTVNACGRSGVASKWSVCVPTIAVREQIGVQDLPFSFEKDKSVRAKFELVQGCAELSPRDQNICRANFSESKINAFNFGSYQDRVRREEKITLPTRAFAIEIPAAESVSTGSILIKALQGTAESAKVHDRAALKIDWIEKIPRSPPSTQQDPAIRPSAPTAPTSQALKIMGFDELMTPYARSAPILAMDPTPVSKDTARLQSAHVNAFSAREVAGPRTTDCPKKTVVAFKPKEWFSPNPFESPGHATEVVGAMAARQVAGSPVYGVLMKATTGARVHALYLDDGKGDPGVHGVVEQIYELRPVTAFWNTCTPIFPIVNVSLKFPSEGPPGAAAPAEGVLFGRASEPDYALYVVAAGNPDDSRATRKKSVKDCNHLPGCKARNTQNMVSVVGLDASGKLASLSSLNGLVFEAAAIGDIRTIDYKGKDTVAYGSSYAAPFVSSLASLIVGKAYALQTNGGGLKPADIKIRVLQTVDFLSDRSIVEFGRINFARALEIGRDALVVSSPIPNLRPTVVPFCPTEANCYLGNVRKTGILKSIKGYDISGSQIELKELELNRILRLRRTGKNTWTVIYVELATNSAKARILHDVTLDGVDQITFSYPNDGERTVSLNSVQDYTRCMWRKGNDGVCIGGDL